MADNRIIRILLEARDQASAVLAKATSGWKGFQLQIKSWKAEAADLLKNRLVQGIGLAGLWTGLQRAWGEADKVEASVRKLGGTAKIAGVPLAFLEDVAANAKNAFKLSTAQSNDFASAIVKLTNGAGRLPETDAALKALLDTGAARGLSASESLERLNQALAGQDEGTDFLFNKNPSVIYKEWADRAGVTVGKMTDMQKYQALLDETLMSGAKVRDAHLAYLQSAAGQTEILRNKTADSLAEFGAASSSLRDVLLPAATAAADGLSFVVKAVQTFGAAIGNMVWNTIDGIKGIGTIVVRFLSGDVNGAIDAAKDMGKTLRDNWQSTTAAVDDIWADHNTRRRGADYKAELDMIADKRKAEQLRRQQAAQAAAASKEQAKERADALKKIDELSSESALSLVNEQHRAWLELTAKFNTELAKLQGDDRRKGEAALKTAQQNLVQVWAGFNQQVTPQITYGTTLLRDNTKLQGMALDDLGGVLDRYNTKTGRYTSAQLDAMRAAKAWRDELLNVSGEITSTAGKLQGLAHDLEPVFGSAFVDQIDRAVGAITEMGTAVGRIAGGDILGGVTQGVGALVSLGKTIFGSSDGLKKALSENNGRLKELRTTMGDLINVQQSGREIVGIQKALQAALPRLSGKLDSGERQLLDRELVKVGLDRQALNDMAEALGIRIRDDNGELQTDLLRNLLSAIGLLDTDWGQTYRGQRDRITQGVGIGAITDELSEAVRLLTDPTLGSRAIGTALAGQDLSTAAGRGGAVAALQQLFANIGSLSVADLGGLNRAEFTDAISWLVDLLTATTEAATTVPDPAEPAPSPTEPEPASVPVPALDPVETVTAGVDYWTELLATSTVSASHLTELVGIQQSALAELTTLTAAAQQLEAWREADLRLPPLPAFAAFSPREEARAAAAGGTVHSRITWHGDVNVHVPATMAQADAETLARTLAPLLSERINEDLARAAADDRSYRGEMGR